MLPFLLPGDPESAKQSIVSTVYHWMTDADGGFKVFSPAIPNTRCDVSNRFFQLYEAKDPRKSNLGIQKDYRALVQIKLDSTDPSNNGKILPYRLPVKVYQKIVAAMQPSEDEIAMGTQPKDMLNPFVGFDITLKVTKTDSGRNYDDTTIDGTATSMLVDGAVIARTPETEASVVKLLNEKATEFNIVKDYGYVQPDEATMTRAKAVMIEQFGSSTTLWPHIQYAQSNVVAPQAAPVAATPIAPAAITPEAPAAAPATATGLSDVDSIVANAMGNS